MTGRFGKYGDTKRKAKIRKSKVLGKKNPKLTSLPQKTRPTRKKKATP